MRRFTALCASLLLGAGVMGLTAGPAVAADVTVVAAPDPVEPDGVLDVSGAGCPAGSTVHVRVWATDGGSAIDQTAVADATGAFATSVPLVSSFEPGEQVGAMAACGDPADPATPRALDFVYIASPAVVGELSVSPVESTYGDPLTASFTYTPASANGSLGVYLDGELVGSALGHQGLAEVTIPGPLPPGSHVVSAVFDPFVEGPPSAEASVEVLVHRVVPEVALSLRDSSVTTSQRARARVVVASDRVPGPTGRVVVRVDGQRVARTRLAADDSGAVVLRLPRLSRGVHALTARYRGSAVVAPASSAPVSLRVTRR